MVGLAATNSATNSLQSLLARNRLAAARQEAAQAQARVDELRAQLDQAESDAQQRDRTVRNLSQQTRTADPTYTKELKSGSASPINTQRLLADFLDAANARRSVSAAAALPTRNPQGQTTGRIVSVRA
ncbi:MAG: hypothetical protein OHK0048_12620 [Rhodoferax sp.]